ncbi:MAG: hypothetical protein VX346_08375 [Planctomycetota bacterium]|nr:hypothetical protein [Planctomycetota bacterium]
MTPLNQVPAVPPLLRRLSRPLPGRLLQVATRWINLAIAPVVILACGIYRVYATATSPFEEFAGTLLVILLALMWSLCFGLLAPLWRAPGAAQPELDEPQ